MSDTVIKVVKSLDYVTSELKALAKRLQIKEKGQSNTQKKSKASPKKKGRKLG